MANIVRIGLKKEVELTVKDNRIIPCGNSNGANVYANCDEIECWIGSCSDIKSLEEIVGPEKLISSIEESASEYESIALMAALEANDMKYTFFGETRTAKTVK